MPKSYDNSLPGTIAPRVIVLTGIQVPDRGTRRPCRHSRSPDGCYSVSLDLCQASSEEIFDHDPPANEQRKPGRAGGQPPQVECTAHRRRNMLRLIAVAGLALTIATSAQAMTPAPLAPPNDMVTRVAVGCGPGRTRVDGVCVARTTIRHARREVRRCVRWHAGVCSVYE